MTISIAIFLATVVGLALGLAVFKNAKVPGVREASLAAVLYGLAGFGLTDLLTDNADVVMSLTMLVFGLVSAVYFTVTAFRQKPPTNLLVIPVGFLLVALAVVCWRVFTLKH
ncbi:hypothetical protein [Mycobacteroides abscessus]|uniref:hypothetical protein n=1 Tax=Mycobacteroides abscessus TaxID=36809 RepID=UPI000927AE97|nr:hypothetical protein [Mycobacteroides abscessus]SIC06634.1 Uncharacterised protein [Mycobacteroides abscessus subsp. bolletii]SKS56686.1 Uncharacterised protein [Mycobacteroides abscessus subsp. bolletii]